MKKNIFIIPILFILISCANSENEKNRVIEISEKVFVGQINEIYLNNEDYLGRTIKLEGIFLIDKDYDGSYYQAVYRYGPGGCCGIDGIVGLEVKWPLGKTQKYPEQDSWVEAVGELKIENQYLFIELASLTEMKERGKEFVNR